MRKGQNQGQTCGNGKTTKKSNAVLKLANGSEWVTAIDLPTVFQSVQRFKSNGNKFRFVAGNTAIGNNQ